METVLITSEAPAGRTSPAFFDPRAFCRAVSNALHWASLPLQIYSPVGSVSVVGSF